MCPVMLIASNAGKKKVFEMAIRSQAQGVSHLYDVTRKWSPTQLSHLGRVGAHPLTTDDIAPERCFSSKPVALSRVEARVSLANGSEHLM